MAGPIVQRMWRGVVLVVVAVALATSLSPGTALAGVVSLEAGVLSYRSAPGEADAYEVVRARGYVEVRPDPHPAGYSPDGLLVAGTGCAEVTNVDAFGFARTAVRCPSPSTAPAPRLEVHLGDDWDSFQAGSVLRGDFHGGRGDDSIRGAGRVDGGPGADHLRSRSRHGVVRGGPGRDELSAFGAGPVRMYGGPGPDRLDGSRRTDVLRGGPGPDDIEGAGGADVIDLGPGVDESGGFGLGNSGADIVRTRDGRFDYIACLAGRDTVVLDRFDLYEPSCERVKRRGAARSVLYGAAVYRKRWGHDTNELAIGFTCPYDGPRVCDPTFRVRSRRGPVLTGVGRTRELGNQEWVWTMRPEVLHALSHWTRVTMQTRDALGRRYRQTIVCPDGAVEVEPPYEGESVAARIPLSDSRTCQPPLSGLDNWAF
jgi:RTX calcium-binding nonapeptide repeat (4 copies)